MYEWPHPKNLVINAILFVIFLLPLNHLAVFIHEYGHAALAVLTGGTATQIIITTNFWFGGGTYCSGGNQFLAIGGGYIILSAIILFTLLVRDGYVWLIGLVFSLRMGLPMVPALVEWRWSGDLGTLLSYYGNWGSLAIAMFFIIAIVGTCGSLYRMLQASGAKFTH